MFCQGPGPLPSTDTPNRSLQRWRPEPALYHCSCSAKPWHSNCKPQKHAQKWEVRSVSAVAIPYAPCSLSSAGKCRNTSTASDQSVPEPLAAAKQQPRQPGTIPHVKGPFITDKEGRSLARAPSTRLNKNREAVECAIRPQTAGLLLRARSGSVPAHTPQKSENCACASLGGAGAERRMRPRRGT